MMLPEGELVLTGHAIRPNQVLVEDVVLRKFTKITYFNMLDTKYRKRMSRFAICN